MYSIQQGLKSRDKNGLELYGRLEAWFNATDVGPELSDNGVSSDPLPDVRSEVVVRLGEMDPATRDTQLPPASAASTTERSSWQVAMRRAMEAH
jgi:hypothetical protein